MLSSLQISNFKTFRDAARLPLAPITLIYGSNSSGKSTIVQALMLLKQSLESEGAATDAVVFGSSRLLDLGNFQNVISDHDVSKSLRFSLGATGTELMRRMPKAVRESFRELILSISIDADRLGVPSVSRIELRSDTDDLLLAYSRSQRTITREQLLRYIPPRLRLRGNNPYSHTQSFFELTDLNARAPLFAQLFEEYRKRIPNLIEDHQRFSRRFEHRDPLPPTSDEVDREREHDLRRLEARVEQRLKELRNYTFESFIGDLKDYSNSRIVVVNRFLPFSQIPTETTRQSGFSLDNEVARQRVYLEYPFYDLNQVLTSIASAIETELERTTYIGPLREYPERNYIFTGASETSVGARGENLPALLYTEEDRVGELNRLADVMDLGYSIYVRRSQDEELNNVFAIRLQDKVTGARVGLSDVGFGVSQVLPILLQCATTRTNSVVIEQPEIHLNPRLQAALGEVFAESVKNGRKQFIIETHSEHLLLRLQRLVRRKVLSAEQISVLYVSKHREGSSILPIPLAENGDRLIGWPDGFFDDTYRELFDEADLTK